MAVTNFVMKYLTAIFVLIVNTKYSIMKKEGIIMTALEKKLRALANGKDLPWEQTKALLEKLGAIVIPPRGGGSHFKIICKGYSTMYIPVHKGSIKKIYARQIANLLNDLVKE